MAKVMGIAGFSNSGKTTLIVKIAAELKGRGHTVAVIKHDAHGHYKEAEGSDSELFIKSGADSVITVSPHAVHRYEYYESPTSLKELLESAQHYDYILIEGFKAENHPKIAVFQTASQSDILDHLSPKAAAIVTDIEIASKDVPVYMLDDINGITDFIVSFL
jgi:molybdopterin-guanine dinucleotide biosynthesis protein B